VYRSRDQLAAAQLCLTQAVTQLTGESQFAALLLLTHFYLTQRKWEEAVDVRISSLSLSSPIAIYP
jgi:hypothetical protein